MRAARRESTRHLPFGVTKDGHPKHPLYLPYEAEVVAYRG
jgi:hypothetical protein